MTNTLQNMVNSTAQAFDGYRQGADTVIGSFDIDQTDFAQQQQARKQYEADMEAEAYGIVRPRQYQAAA